VGALLHLTGDATGARSSAGPVGGSGDPLDERVGAGPVVEVEIANRHPNLDHFDWLAAERLTPARGRRGARNERNGDDYKSRHMLSSKLCERVRIAPWS
jgi:hypothetical protein